MREKVKRDKSIEDQMMVPILFSLTKGIVTLMTFCLLLVGILLFVSGTIHIYWHFNFLLFYGMDYTEIGSVPSLVSVVDTYLIALTVFIVALSLIRFVFSQSLKERVTAVSLLTPPVMEMVIVTSAVIFLTIAYSGDCLNILYAGIGISFIIGILTLYLILQKSNP